MNDNEYSRFEKKLDDHYRRLDDRLQSVEGHFRKDIDDLYEKDRKQGERIASNEKGLAVLTTIAEETSRQVESIANSFEYQKKHCVKQFDKIKSTEENRAIDKIKKAGAIVGFITGTLTLFGMMAFVIWKLFSMGLTGD